MPEYVGKRSSLTIKELEWAWKKRREGHPEKQVAEALGICTRTLERALTKQYGYSNPTSYIPLTLPEDINEERNT